MQSADYCYFSGFNIPASSRLVRRAFAPHELPSLIDVIFSSEAESDTIRRLLGDDAQAFVDVMDEVRSIPAHRCEPALIKTELTHPINQALDRPDLSLQTRKNCLKSLYRACGRHALLPTRLKILVSYDQTGDAMYRGGFADVWKGKHCDKDVAVKVIRTYSNADLQKIIGVIC